MAKRRSPKEVIESEKDSSIEHVYVQFPGQELIPVSDFSHSQFVSRDMDKIERLYEESGGKRYRDLHEHPSKSNILSKFFGASSTTLLPSYQDFRTFLRSGKMKGMVIGQRNKNSGEVEGYLYLKKPKNFKEIDLDSRKNFEERFDEKHNYNDSIVKSFYEFAKKYGIKYKFIPAKTHKLDWRKRGFVKIKKGNLEKTLISIITIVGFGSGIFFLSPTLTGNAIANLTTKTSSIIGAGLFIIGIVGSYFWFRKK